MLGCLLPGRRIDCTTANPAHRTGVLWDFPAPAGDAELTCSERARETSPSCIRPRSRRDDARAGTLRPWVDRLSRSRPRDSRGILRRVKRTVALYSTRAGPTVHRVRRAAAARDVVPWRPSGHGASAARSAALPIPTATSCRTSRELGPPPRPCASMPSFFWTTPGRGRYRASYSNVPRALCASTGTGIEITERGTSVTIRPLGTEHQPPGGLCAWGRARLPAPCWQVPGGRRVWWGNVRCQGQRGVECRLFVGVAEGAAPDGTQGRAIQGAAFREECSRRHVPTRSLRSEEVGAHAGGKVLEAPVRRSDGNVPRERPAAIRANRLKGISRGAAGFASETVGVRPPPPTSASGGPTRPRHKLERRLSRAGVERA